MKLKIVKYISFSIAGIILISAGLWKFYTDSSFLGFGGGAKERITVFIDDGLSVSDGVEVITLNAGGSPGLHFDNLWKEYSAEIGVSDGILVIDVVGEENIAYPEDIASAIDLAVDRGAKIVNISLSTLNADTNLQRAVERAVRKGVIVVSSTASGLENMRSYPASFPDVIGVYPKASLEKNYWFSNTQGADLGVVVPPEGGSSLAAVMLTAKINQCFKYEIYPGDLVVQGLIACETGVAVAR